MSATTILTMMAAAFFGAWIGWAAVWRKVGKSWTVSLGGGFIVGCLITGIAGWLIGLYDSPPTPATLREAGLDTSKKWSGDQLRLAADISRNNLKNIEAALKEADKKGDAAMAVTLYDPMLALLTSWNIQSSLQPLGNYRDCQLAAAHLAEGISTVVQGGRYLNVSRFSAALDGCKG